MLLHDQTRRLISLLLFFLLGPMLTFGILGGIVLRKLPFNARNAERTMAVRTGLDWKIESVEYRSPNVVRLNRVRLLHFSSPEPIFSAEAVDLTFLPGKNREEYFSGIEKTSPPESDAATRLDELIARWISTGPSNGFHRMTIPKSVLRLDSKSPDVSATAVQESFFKLLARFGTLCEEPVQIAFDEIEIVGPENMRNSPGMPDRIRQVVGNFYRTPTDFRSDWSFQLPKVSETETLRVSVVQHRQGNGYAIGLKTGRQPIPCPWAALACPTFHAFGPGSLFSGEMLAEYHSGSKAGWTLRFSEAFLNNLDVAPFAAEYAPGFEVKGTVKGLALQSATFGQGTLTAEGWLDVVDGSLDRALFLRLVERFALSVYPSETLEAPYGSIPFDRCFLRFRLLPEGAVFWTDAEKNVFIKREGDGLTKQGLAVYFPADQRRPIPYHTIMSVLAPDTAPIVPLTPGSQRILSMIPSDGLPTPKRSQSRPENIIPERTAPELFTTLPDGSMESRPVQPNVPQPVAAPIRPQIAQPFVPENAPAPQPGAASLFDHSKLRNDFSPSRTRFRDPSSRDLPSGL